MKMKTLCTTLSEVSELCFNAAPMGTLMSKITEEEGAQLILAALEHGINFLETTDQVYQPYSRIKRALDQFSGDVVLSVRSTASNQKEMFKAIAKACEDLDRDYIDLMMLHINKSTVSLLADKAGVFEGLLEAKSKGWIRAIGLSTHSARLLREAAEIEFIDVLSPAINVLGFGILEGYLSDLLQVIQDAYGSGKGIYATKSLAGGRLANYPRESLNFVRGIPEMSSVAIGMRTHKELQANLNLFEEPLSLSPRLSGNVMLEKESLINLTFLEDRSLKRFPKFCKGCGICINNCPAEAIRLHDGKAQVDEDKCIMCGYCASVCPQFALRLD